MPNANKRKLIDGPDFIQNVVDYLDSQSEFVNLNYRILNTVSGDFFLELTHKVVDIVSNEAGPYHSARLVIGSLTTRFIVFGNTLQTDRTECLLTHNFEGLREYLRLFTGEHRCCEGIPLEVYKLKSENVRYNVKDACQSFVPSACIRSRKCSWWFKVGRTKYFEGEAVKICVNCRKLQYYVKDRGNINKKSERSQRLSVSSHYPLSLLSPQSRSKRLGNIAKKRENQSRRIRKLKIRIKNLSIELNTEQSKEMHDAVHLISEQFRDDVEKVIGECKDESMRSQIRETWEQDRREKRDFYEAQLNNGKC